ncbi:MAG: ATP-binding protein [Comamonadaceae bacterium]|nr:ATP-binding protein [Comamonadaceae bacterium]
MTTSTLRRIADLSIDADGSSTRLASQWLAKSASDFEVPVSELDRLDLCLNEVLANIISHGLGSEAKPLVHVVLQVEHDDDGTSVATVTVSDAGPAFDITLAGDHCRPASLADAQPGGLGLLMIRSFSDDLRYRYSGGQNHLSFAVRWINSDE